MFLLFSFYTNFSLFSNYTLHAIDNTAPKELLAVVGQSKQGHK